MKEITIQVPDGKKAEWKEVNGITTLVLMDEEVKDNRPVTERIKTFNDALEELGEEHPLVKEYWEVVNVDFDIHQDLISYLKLRIIATALNEGWEPYFTKDEYRYYPWFYLYTEEELEDKSEEWKKEHSLVLWGGVANNGAVCGLAFVDSHNAFSYSNAALGARLAVKSDELATYFGKQFTEIWADYCGPFNRK